MRQFKILGVAVASALVAACGGGGDSDLTKAPPLPAKGAMAANSPAPVIAFTAAGLTAKLDSSTSGQGLKQVAGAPVCGVDVRYMQYGTVGGAGEATDASGVMMVPTGTAAGCSGARPVVLYAHGTTLGKDYNLADVANPNNPAAGETGLLMAMYAAQGFIVVAPNYAGYDTSRLSYHPYLNATQSATEMMDALSAARSALPNLNLPVSDSGKLFLTGYSQGGHVAMATHRAMQAAGMPVTASAPMSGPYAVGAFMDAVFYGNVNLGSTVFSPLLINSYQKAYGNLYTNLTDIYEPAYAAGIDSLLPSTTPSTTLFAQGKLPQTQLFSSTAPAAPFAAITPPTTPAAQAPLFAMGFGTANLINNATRLAYLLDAQAHPDGAVPTPTTGTRATGSTNRMRTAAIANDLRTWTPLRPMLLCGGSGDPTVFYSANTQVMQGYWSAPSPAAAPAGILNVLNVDSAITGASDPYASAKGGFALTKTNTATAAVAAGATDGGASAVIQAYHGSLVPPFCNAAARGFFQKVLAAGI